MSGGTYAWLGLAAAIPIVIIVVVILLRGYDVDFKLRKGIKKRRDEDDE